MTERMSVKLLDSLTARLCSAVGVPHVWEGGPGWTMYEVSLKGGRWRQIAYGRTKSELYDLAESYLSGVERARRPHS